MQDLLIDLDNTVYPKTQIYLRNRLKDEKFYSKKFKCFIDEAFKIQKKYFVNNGTTLRGLMLYHNVQPESF